MPMTHLAPLGVYKTLMRKTVTPKLSSAGAPGGLWRKQRHNVGSKTFHFVIVKSYY
jgi:hypothetical protein